MHKDDFKRSDATVRFNRNGKIIINRCAVDRLDLFDEKTSTWGCVSMGRDTSRPADFVISNNSEGWPVRRGEAGGAVFNNAALAVLVIDKTWAHSGHAVGECKPRSYCFNLARLPVDEDKNKFTYALLRKKI